MAVASPARLPRDAAGDVAGTVGVVGEDGITRSAVVQLLESATFKVVFQTPDPAAAGNGLQADEVVEAVVVVENPERHGLVQDVRTLRAQLPDASLIVAVGADGRRGTIQSALGAGARAYVALDRVNESFLPSLAAALAGQLVLPTERDGHLLSGVLTSREKQVLALVVMGLSNAEIATKLYLAESTVQSHLSSAFAKLGVRSRNEAAATILDPNSGVGTGILGIPSQDGREPT
jgi:DNA-binding NarL/FixJ family response regulator